LQSGGPILAAADLRLELGLSAGLLAAVLFTVPILVSLLIEPLAALATDRVDARRLLVGALLLVSVAELVIISTTGPWTLCAAISVWGVGMGVADIIAEVALVNPSRGSKDDIMLRWAFWGLLGDLLGPLLFGGAALLGLGWRAVLAGAAIVSLVDAVLVALGPPMGSGTGEDDPDVPLRDAWAAQARQPGLWPWLIATALCSLFDETFVAFGTLWLRAGGVSPAAQGFAFGAFALGGAIGLRLTSRYVPDVRRRLAACATGLLVTFPGWLLAPPVLVVPATALLGVFASPLWPLSMARAYSSGPPALIAALAAILDPIDVVVPAALGQVADHVGLGPALLLLLVQPLGILLVLRWTTGGRKEARPSAGGQEPA
jgi:MFS family permease